MLPMNICLALFIDDIGSRKLEHVIFAVNNFKTQSPVSVLTETILRLEK